jgi:hypothetical protein
MMQYIILVIQPVVSYLPLHSKHRCRTKWPLFLIFSGVGGGEVVIMTGHEPSLQCASVRVRSHLFLPSSAQGSRLGSDETNFCRNVATDQARKQGVNQVLSVLDSKRLEKGSREQLLLI